MLKIPHLKTAYHGSLSPLENQIFENQVNIENWFEKCWQNDPPILTSSVDLRNAGFKIAVIDTNLFPAGYNNLNPDFFPLCEKALKNTLLKCHPHCQKILIIAENHTRNTHYYQSIATLALFFQNAGFEVKISQLSENVELSKDIYLQDGGALTIYPIDKKDNVLFISDFTPCLIVLNNDLSSGIPSILEGIKQSIEPPLQLGWSLRRKTTHFNYYQEVCAEFSELINIDPWQISPLFLNCDDINFIEKEGIDFLAEKTQILLDAIQKKYDEYGIKDKPFVVVKADAGTYGMAVMSIQDPKDFENLNRKQRISMSTSKGGKNVSQVIIQEGIPTIEKIGKDNLVAEPVIYMLGPYVVGGFYRAHPTRNFQENLNSPGMQFEKLEYAACCTTIDQRAIFHESQNQFYVYSVIARLGLLASAKEKSALMMKDQ